MGKSEPGEAHRKSDVETVIYSNFGSVSPDIVEHVHHNQDGFVPYQSIVSLPMLFRISQRTPLRTYLRKRGSGDLSILLPLLSFRSHNVWSKNSYYLISIHGLGKPGTMSCDLLRTNV